MTKPSRSLIRTLAFTTGLAISWAMGPSALAKPTMPSLQERDASDYYYQDVYGDLAVESTRLGDGEFSVNILVDGVRRATYELSVSAQEGRWYIFDSEGSESSQDPQTTTIFDYSQAQVRGYEGAIADLLARHTVVSVALSAVLLWEDYLEASAPAVVWPVPDLPEVLPEQSGLPAVDDYSQCMYRLYASS